MKEIDAQGTDLFKNLNTDKQERVFQSALNEFAANGYRNASMNNVVKAAGISKGSLFQYFRTKSDLFTGVVDMAASRVKSYLRQVRDDTAAMPFFTRIERLLGSGFDFIDRHPLLARVYFRLLESGEAPFGSERILELRRQGDHFLAELILSGIERGELRRDIDPERTAFLVNSLMETLLRSYYTEYLASGPGLYRGEDAERERWIETTLDLIRRGLERSEHS
jgi:TetR/AcrR family transcriptional regulator